MLFWLHVWWYLQHLNNLFLHVVYAGWLPIKEILRLSRKFFQRPQIALALRARAILLAFEKIYSCLLIPNCTRNHVITCTNMRR